MRTIRAHNVNHPTFDGYKLDITFRSFEQIEQFVADEIKKAEREPNLVRGVILFDKTGRLTALQKKTQKTKPQQHTSKDHQWHQFMLYHANSKVERFLQDDPAASLYSMHANIGEVLKTHFKLHGKWWVSSKNVLKSSAQWDAALADLVRRFVASADTTQKYKHGQPLLIMFLGPWAAASPLPKQLRLRNPRQTLVS